MPSDIENNADGDLFGADHSKPRIVRIWDCETTGFPENEASEVIELGRIDLDLATGAISNPWAALAQPLRPIPPETKAVHHITEAMVAGAPRIGTLWRQFWEGHKAPDLVAAHNAEFEKHFHHGNGREWICTYKSALVVWPDAPGHGNQTLRYWLDLDAELDFIPALAEPPHRALPDAYTTAFILRRLLREKTADELVAISKYPALLRVMNFGKHRGMTFEDAPADYLEWIADKSDMNKDVKFSAKYWLKKRGFRK
jgi:exodeoxyribonuclease X